METQPLATWPTLLPVSLDGLPRLWHLGRLLPSHSIQRRVEHHRGSGGSSGGDEVSVGGRCPEEPEGGLSPQRGRGMSPGVGPDLAEAQPSPAWALAATVPPPGTQRPLPPWSVTLNLEEVSVNKTWPLFLIRPLNPASLLPSITASALICPCTWFCGFNLDVVREVGSEDRLSTPPLHLSPADSSALLGPRAQT